MINIPWWSTLNQDPNDDSSFIGQSDPDEKDHIEKKPQQKSGGWFALVDKMCKRKVWKQQGQAPHRLVEFTH